MWDYPRPPRLERERRRVRVVLGGVTIADTDAAPSGCSRPATRRASTCRRADFAPGSLRAGRGLESCEWKGRAAYLDLVGGDVTAPRAAWSYPSPTPAFAALAGYVSLYPGRMDSCRVGDALVQAQEGDFYGGWITPEIVGPFKGPPGTWGW